MTGPSRGDSHILSLRGVGKRYGLRWVLRDVDMTLSPGELVALLGESGAGKSTLLNLIAGLEAPDAGEIELAGVPVHTLDADASANLRRSTLGFQFQAFHLIAHMSAAHNVAIPLLLNGVGQTEALARAKELLAQVGLGDRAAGLPSELSGGEQQRVALARALVHRPALLLADEPTGNLDPVTADVALSLLAEQVRGRGAALLMVTHSEHAAAIADRRFRLGPDGLVPV
jgi:putative ABC transport system ATP-binding protein